MKKLILVLAIFTSVASFSQKETTALAMMPEGTILTLKKDYVIPADSSIVFLNRKGGQNNGGSFSNIHLVIKQSDKWRKLQKGTQFTVKGFINMPHIQSFKFIFEDENVFLFVDHMIRPMQIEIGAMDDFFEIVFPPMEIYGTDEYEAPKDTIIISPLLPAEIDSLNELQEPKDVKKTESSKEEKKSKKKSKNKGKVKESEEK